MDLGHFYFLNDQYYIDFPDVKGIMKMLNLGTVKMYNWGIFFFVI